MLLFARYLLSHLDLVASNSNVLLVYMADSSAIDVIRSVQAPSITKTSDWWTHIELVKPNTESHQTMLYDVVRSCLVEVATRSGM